jgi:hypothetical protein
MRKATRFLVAALAAIVMSGCVFVVPSPTHNYDCTGVGKTLVCRPR